MTRRMTAALIILSLTIAVGPTWGWEISRSSSMADQSGTASALAIDAMFVGDKVLQVTGRRQLTLSSEGKIAGTPHISPDGRYVVYLLAGSSPDAVSECRLVKTLTGRSATVMSHTPPDEPQPASKEAWWMDAFPGIAWSPNSSQFALLATRVIWETGKRTQQRFIVVYAASGAFRKALPIDPQQSSEGLTVVVPQTLRFTPDSRSILAGVMIPKLVSDNRWEFYAAGRLFDIASGSTRDISMSKVDSESPGSLGLLPLPSVIGWSADGSLLLIDWSAGGKLHKIALDGKSDVVLRSDCLRDEFWSSDGQFSVVSAGGLLLRSRGAATPIMLVANPQATVSTWAPNNKMFLYTRPETMLDDDRARKRHFRSLWLSDINAKARGSLCVAVDAEQLCSASLDCRRIAYVSQGQLYVGELSYRAPTISEKTQVGLPLTEQEKNEATKDSAN